MSVDIIKEVKAAEGKADDMRREAAADAKRIVAEARIKGAELIESMKSEGDREAADLLEKAKSDASAKAAEVAKEADAECASIKSQAEPRLDAAVQIIVGRVVT